MKLLVLLFVLLISGCAQRTASEYVPFVREVTDTSAYQTDLETCRKYAQEYLSGKGDLNPSEMARQGVTAGMSDLGYSVVSPVAPALGALGGATGEALSELGLSSVEARKVIINCMYDKGSRSGAYHVYDPHL